MTEALLILGVGGVQTCGYLLHLKFFYQNDDWWCELWYPSVVVVVCPTSLNDEQARSVQKHYAHCVSLVFLFFAAVVLTRTRLQNLVRE